MSLKGNLTIIVDKNRQLMLQKVDGVKESFVFFNLTFSVEQEIFLKNLQNPFSNLIQLLLLKYIQLEKNQLMA